MKTSFASAAFLAMALVVAAPQRPVQAAAATGTVSGRLFDGHTQEPIPHSYVVVLRATDGRLMKTTETDAQGRFRVAGLPLGRYVVRTTVLGYHAIRPAVALHPAKPRHTLGTVVLVPLTMPQVAQADKQAWASRGKAVAAVEPRRPAVRVRS
ncbi:carboxypeptidase-like regulatory domain-containing protein [Hymenobacter sp. HSC-4F20]|uniref:carboxypeptidase-like regulatory domain-containing protein n=1 Tax=Hymenobacter sp. HSC-4F20 TaxID=2864135 RepID=UPI001C735623|nr:carboxypeptidase-like regulatory domain-containing protein [Hymenobacter sp. HSC-4F20]MBX0290077.1 carboxypeptidase-like regulatory domain-containing protein [Hymenobacter sp. HSC-4F20]